MQIKHVKVENFASYRELEFTFDNQGLTLIQGPTGSGKSTLCDIVPWVLFGRTSKGGTVDEVLTWPGNQVCRGECQVGNYLIIRTRGPKAKDNDLYYIDLKDSEPHTLFRGKDLQDTQKIINDLLGMDYDLYLSGSYFHEFSQTAQFFITTAKNRRAICEQLTDLSLAKKLQVNISADKKRAKFDVITLEGEISNNKVHLQYIETNYRKELKAQEAWEKDHIVKVSRLNEKYENFKQDKESKISTLQASLKTETTTATNIYDSSNSKLRWLKATGNADLVAKEEARIKRLQDNHKAEKCSECGGDKDHKFLALLQEDKNKLVQLKSEIKVIQQDIKYHEEKMRTAFFTVDSLQRQLEQAKAQQNIYGEQLDVLLTETNPHTENAARLKQDLAEATDKQEQLCGKLADLKQKQSDLELLSDIIENYRGDVVKNTITNIEDRTNALLTDYFDGEIRINLLIEDADKVEVNIYKDSNLCSYSQLSKGQRQMLKFTFGLSVMQAVSNHNGIKFEQIWIDEALDGLDDNMKMKAVNMLEALATEYSSIYVVDHSETVKAMVNNKIEVTLVNGESILAHE